MNQPPDRLPDVDDVRLMLYCERAETLDDSPWTEAFGHEARTLLWRSQRPYSLINVSPYVEMEIPGDLVVSLWLRGGVNYAGEVLVLLDDQGFPTGEILPMTDPPDLRDLDPGKGDHRLWRMEGCFSVKAPGRYDLVLVNMRDGLLLNPAIMGTNLEIRAK
ncbi:MAG: hypothetical protein ACR2MY_07000 [Candidatus Dormibacteria bacterium]